MMFFLIYLSFELFSSWADILYFLCKWTVIKAGDTGVGRMGITSEWNPFDVISY